MRLQSSQSGKLNVNISLARQQFVTSNTASSSNGINSVTMKANSGNTNPISFTAEAQIVTSGGRSHLDIFRSGEC